MNRRNFISHSVSKVLEATQITTDPDVPENPLANQKIPDLARITSGLAPFAGTWDYAHASHLLRRCLFGPKHSEISQSVIDGLDATLDLLFAPQPLPSPPLNYYFENDPNVPVGATWIDAFFVQGAGGYRRRSLWAWTIKQMIEQPVSLVEKMALFWHNHFSIEQGVVNDARYLYKYYTLFRERALGNFQTLTEEITVDPAMLRYLNGNQNDNTAPNENYARELFELFTIGKGPQVGAGDYTTYTEQDVQAAARVLTGWKEIGYNNVDTPIQTAFLINKHDIDPKTFSYAFDNHTINNNGQDEYKDLISMIFSKVETAKYICRKLYRWFVYYIIDEDVETNVIEPLADALMLGNYEIAPVLRTLLKSEHFFDVLNQGCLIKNPLDYTLSIPRQFELTFPDQGTDLESHYRHYLNYYLEAGKSQQTIFSPPSVAGWVAYYQLPQFHEMWINSVTLPIRAGLATRMVFQGFTAIGITVKIDPLEFINFVSDALDPNLVIGDWCRLLLPQPITQGQIDFLKEVLIPGLPDYEWTIEYGDYLANPGDQNLENAVRTKLGALLNTILNLAEYHLS